MPVPPTYHLHELGTQAQSMSKNANNEAPWRWFCNTSPWAR